MRKRLSYPLVSITFHLPLVLVVLLVMALSQEAGAEKIFNYALDGPPDTLDWAKTASLRTQRVSWLLCDQLLYVSKDGKGLEPGLAESWRVSADGREVTMRLRPNATFHDATPVNASAIKASIDRQFRPQHPLYTKEPGNAREKMLTELLTDVQAKDERTLVLKLGYPGLHYLGEVDLASPTALDKMGKDFGRNPVCSGPYKFESWSKEHIVLSANEKYWAGRPKLDKVVFHIISQSDRLRDVLLKGDLDFAPVITDPTLLERIRENQNLTLLTVPGLNVFYLGMYNERPPFNSATARRSVVQAIDTSRMAQILGRGTAERAKGPLPPAMKYYDPAVSQAPYDPNAARELLKTTPLEKGTVKLVFTNTIGLMNEMAGAVRSDLGRIGLNVEFMGKPSFSEVVAAARAREGDMFIYNWHVSAPYPERLLMPLFASKATQTNLTQYRNLAVDSMLEEAMRVPEETKQQKLYARIQQTIVADAPMVFLFHWTRMSVQHKRVRGLELKLDSSPSDKLVTVDVEP